MRVGRLHFLANWTFLGRRLCSTLISMARSKRPTFAGTTIGPTPTSGKSERPAVSSWGPAGFSPAPAGFSLAPAGFSLAPAGFSPAPADFSLAPAGFSPAPALAAGRLI